MSYLHNQLLLSILIFMQLMSVPQEFVLAPTLLLMHSNTPYSEFVLYNSIHNNWTRPCSYLVTKEHKKILNWSNKSLFTFNYGKVYTYSSSLKKYSNPYDLHMGNHCLHNKDSVDRVGLSFQKVNRARAFPTPVASWAAKKLESLKIFFVYIFMYSLYLKLDFPWKNAPAFEGTF